jgi:hypothetical protein
MAMPCLVALRLPLASPALERGWLEFPDAPANVPADTGAYDRSIITTLGRRGPDRSTLMRYRILTVTAIALATLAFHGCGDDAKPIPVPSTSDTAKPADAAKPTTAPVPPATTTSPAAPSAPTPAPAPAK